MIFEVAERARFALLQISTSTFVLVIKSRWRGTESDAAHKWCPIGGNQDIKNSREIS